MAREISGPILVGDFTQPVHVNIGEKMWVTTEDYQVEWRRAGVGRRITIYRGAEWNKASTPVLMWWHKDFRRDGPIEGASLVHDILCRNSGWPSSQWKYETRLRGDDGWTENTSRWDLDETNNLYYWFGVWAGISEKSMRVQERFLNFWPPLRARYYS